MSEKCVICKKAWVENSQVCGSCVSECRKQLFAIPQLVLAAEEFLQPGRSGRGGNGEVSIGVNVNALDYVTGIELLGVFYAIEDEIREKQYFETHPPLREGEEMDPIFKRRTPKGPIAERVKVCCEFLLVHFEWLKKQDYFPDSVAEIAEQYSKGVTATKGHNEKITRLRCPADLGEEICDAWIVLDSLDLNELVTCKRCKSQWSLAWLVHVRLNMPDKRFWVDSEAIGQHFQMTKRQVRQFVKVHGIRQNGSLIEIAEFKRVFEIVKLSNQLEGQK